MFIYGLLLFLAGLLAVPELILGHHKALDRFFKNLIPFRSLIGLIIFLLALWDLVMGIVSTDLFNASLNGWAILSIQLILGFLLGFDLIEYILSRFRAGSKKTKKIHSALIPYQFVFGLLGMILGLSILF
jgi:uncharacterized membrane protein